MITVLSVYSLLQAWAILLVQCQVPVEVTTPHIPTQILDFISTLIPATDNRYGSETSYSQETTYNSEDMSSSQAEEQQTPEEQYIQSSEDSLDNSSDSNSETYISNGSSEGMEQDNASQEESYENSYGSSNSNSQTFAIRGSSDTQQQAPPSSSAGSMDQYRQSSWNDNFNQFSTSNSQISTTADSSFALRLPPQYNTSNYFPTTFSPRGSFSNPQTGRSFESVGPQSLRIPSRAKSNSTGSISVELDNTANNGSLHNITLVVSNFPNATKITIKNNKDKL